MNVHKHMEAIFVTLLATAGIASVAVDRIQPAQAHAVQQAKVAGDVPVVVVTAKRPRRA